MHSPTEYEDPMPGTAAHVATDKSSSQPANITICTCHQKRLITAEFVKMKPSPSQNCSGHSRASSSPKNLQCIAGGAAEVSNNIQYTNHSPSEWTYCRVTASHPQPNEPYSRLSYRESHWTVPVRLTAAQPGPWLRSGTLLPLSEQ